MAVGIEVVAQAEIERQIVMKLPVILHPARKDVPDDGVPVLRVRQGVIDPPRDGGQRRQIPRRGVVPDRKERLEIGRRRPAPRVNLAHAPQAPPKLVMEPHVIAAHFHVVTSTPFVRRGEVIANRLGVLQDVERAGANGVAAQQDDHRSAVKDGIVGEVPALPPDAGLVLPVVVGDAPLDLVD